MAELLKTLYISTASHCADLLQETQGLVDTQRTKTTLIIHRHTFH